MKKYILTSLFLLIGIGFFNTAKAETIIITEPGTGGNIPITAGYINTATSTWNLDSGSAFNFRMLIQNASGTILGTSATVNTNGTGSSPTWWFTNIQFNFATPVYLELYQTYYLITQIDVYSNGNWNNVPGGGSSNTGYYTTPTPINLSFQYPFDTTSINTDFTHFQINANNPSTAIQGASIEISLSKNSNFTLSNYFTDNETHILQPNTTTTFNIAKSISLLSNTTYYAKVRNLGTNTSSTISFNTGQLVATTYTGTPLYEGSPLTQTEYYNGLVSTSSIFYIDCSAYDNTDFFSSSTFGMIGCIAKKVIWETTGWMVTPPDWAIEYIMTRIENMKTAFPFSLVYETIGGIQTGLNQTQSSQPLNLNLPQIGLNTNILSSQTLENEIGTTSTALFNSTFESVIWIFAGIATLIIITI